MGLKKKFSSRLEREKYVTHLTNLSSMPANERSRWHKILPNMAEKEVAEFTDILEREITELADIYLRVLQRRAESRTADLKVEFGENNLMIDEDEIGKNFDLNPKIDEESYDVMENKPETKNEVNILRYLIAHASFIEDRKKEKLLENVNHLPLRIVKNLQMVMIREGLRVLKARRFQQISDASLHSPQTLTQALI